MVNSTGDAQNISLNISVLNAASFNWNGIGSTDPYDPVIGPYFGDPYWVDPNPGCGGWTVPAPNNGYPGSTAVPNTLPNAQPYDFTIFTTKPLISKSKQKADILAGFFNQDLHALVVMGDDGGARFIPFMDKFNMIWMQDTLNSWAAYDRDKFMAFIDSEDLAFSESPLSKMEVLKRFHTPEKPK